IESAYPNPSSSDSFWNASAENLLGVLLKAVHNMPPELKNLGFVHELLTRFGFEPETVNGILNQYFTEANRNRFMGFLALEDKMKNSVLATTQTALKAMSDPNLLEISSSHSLNFEKLRTSKQILFIRVREDLISRFQFFLGVFFSQLFEFLMQEPVIGQPYNSVLLLLEEAGNIYVPSLDKLVNTIRKRGVSTSLLLQDNQQLEALYGKNKASAILNGGMTSKIIYPGVSIETCELFERMLGAKTVQLKEHGFGSINSEQKNRMIDQGRSLMTAEEIRTMKDHHLFVSAASKPILLKTYPYYKIPELVKRSNLR
ncbi:MAG: type IV secretory system conjugative DNA transfer family protein, partial [Bacteroidota bacterium]